MARSTEQEQPDDVIWGFIGLGQMGYPVAMKLRENMPKSYTLLISDVNDGVLSRFVEHFENAAERNGPNSRPLNVQITRNARELAERSSIVVTCLPTPRVVKSVFDAMLIDGKLPHLKQERLFIDCSTIDPPTSRALARAVRDVLDVEFVDAPVSGGVVAARAGTLSLMFGTTTKSQKSIKRIKSILSLMGQKICHVGEQGAGVAGKLANNYILAINNIATAEAMSMGLRWGIDPKVLTELINSSTGRCWPTEVNNPVPGVIEGSPASNGYEAGGTVAVIQKDLRLAMSGAEDSGVGLMLASKADEVYTAVEKVYSGKDFSIVYKWMQDNTSTEY
ncbi:hypothetical protein H2200_000383 [Cladophialophora chaetospira]|uniref:3-hydroxyisobutyrate dehydrogenase n=1 Tax=Cladophialophora chaetospira TaxID=386627 RepID=A0AA38XPC8_9EURO|nr:hypothetical protein H2200_000383 [Cladophialophora chaetospira]